MLIPVNVLLFAWFLEWIFLSIVGRVLHLDPRGIKVANRV